MLVAFQVSTPDQTVNEDATTHTRVLRSSVQKNKKFKPQDQRGFCIYQKLAVCTRDVTRKATEYGRNQAAESQMTSPLNQRGQNIVVVIKKCMASTRALN